jgi:hypothetical protein
MNAISEVDFQKNINKIYQSVFASEDPYGSPFQPSIKPRQLLYWFRYGLLDTEPWLIPVTNAIKAIGEKGFYLTILERGGAEPYHWYVPLDEAHLYIDKIYPLCNAIYSVKGLWGIICSEQDHAVVGGSEFFVDIIQKSISDWDYRITLFLNTWKEYHEQNKDINIDWLPNFFMHIYGDKIPEVILNDPKLRYLLRIK